MAVVPLARDAVALPKGSYHRSPQQLYYMRCLHTQRHISQSPGPLLAAAGVPQKGVASLNPAPHLPTPPHHSHHHTLLGYKTLGIWTGRMSLRAPPVSAAPRRTCHTMRTSKSSSSAWLPEVGLGVTGGDGPVLWAMLITAFISSRGYGDTGKGRILQRHW